MNTRYLTLLSLSLTTAAWAQTGQITQQRDISQREDMLLSYEHSSSADIDGNTGEISYGSVGMRVPIYLFKKDQFRLGFGLAAEHTHLDTAGIPEIGDHDLYRIGMDTRLQWRNPAWQRWGFMAIYSPRVATNFDSVNGDDIRHSSSLLASYQASSVRWLFGLRYSDNTNDDYVLPFIGFDWHATDALRLSLLGPRFDLRYRLNDELMVGAFASYWSRGWGVNDDQQLEITSWRIGAQSAYTLNDHFTLEGDLGVHFGGDIELLDQNDRGLYDQDSDAGLYFRVGLRYTF